MADGSTFRAERPAPAAGVILRAPDGRCLFLQRARGNFVGHWAWPGGTREPGEASDETALRELEEEAGYSPDLSEPAQVVHSTNDFVTHLVDVPQAFEPTLNDEHYDYQWAWPAMAPEPLHPGVAATIEEVGTDALLGDCGLGQDGDFNEGDHPRQEDGKFGSGGGGRTIRLGGGQDPGPANAFLASWQPPAEGAKVNVVKGPNQEIIIKEISSPVQGEGHGRQALKSLTDLADKTGVKLRLTPSRLEGGNLDDRQLSEWYGRHGFVKGLQGMVRQPKQVAQDTLAQDADILAFDRGSVRTKDKDGRLHVELTNISKANICPYRGEEIPDWRELGLEPGRVYQLLRDPEELAKAAPTFRNLPLLNRHVPVTAEAHKPELVIGSLGTDATYADPYLKNSLVVWAADAIKAIELADADPEHEDAMKELSSAYYYKADMTPGYYLGARYDGVMRDIVGNHVALVKDGRAGADVIVGDTAMPKLARDGTWNEDDHQRAVNGQFGAGGASQAIKDHPNYSEKDWEYLRAKGWSDAEIKERWDSEHKDGKGPVKHFKGPDMVGYLNEGKKGAADRTAMDSKETTMSKTVLTRKGALLQGALTVYLKPLLAQDAQIDLAPALKGVGPKNFKSRKATIASAVTAATQGKLAQDASLDGLVGLLDALEDVAPIEAMDEEEPDFLAGAADADDPSEKVMAFLQDKISADDCAAVKSMLSPPAAQDEDDSEDEPEPKPAEDEDETEAEPKPAEDEDEEEMVTKTAMDAAISASVKAATEKAARQQREIRVAEEAVRPWVGNIMAQDSAAGVYSTALKALGVDVNGVHPSAFPAILKAQPLPGAKRRDTSPALAQDSAQVKSFAERFPDAARIANV